MAQQQILQMTALQRAQALAAWAGHQWGQADLVGDETTPAEIAARTRATTTPGAMGWGIASPDLTENGWVVRVGRAVRAEIGDGYLRFSVSQRDGGAITWENGAWVFSLYETSYNELTDNTIRIVPGRMVARSLAILVVLGIIDDDDDIWVVRERAGFPPFEAPNGELDAAAEAEEYWRLRYNAGHLLAGPRYNWEREAEREWEDLLDNMMMTVEQAEAIIGMDVFWSRFGGWKVGLADRDDNAGEGYATLDALVECWRETEALAEAYDALGRKEAAR